MIKKEDYDPIPGEGVGHEVPERNGNKKTVNYFLLIYWPSQIMYQISGTGSHKRFQASKTVTDLVTFKHYLSFLVQIILLRRCTNATNIQMLHEMIKKRERNGNKKN